MQEINFFRNILIVVFGSFLVVLIQGNIIPIRNNVAPPPDSSREDIYRQEEEKLKNYQNMTMDQIITQMLGGVNEAGNRILAEGSSILAELDMYLTPEQFSDMYEPPSPQEMVDMGILPAPLGVVRDSEYQRKFADTEADFKYQRKKRKAARNEKTRWPEGVMPYVFADGHFDTKEVYEMLRSMTEWERYTCLKFKPASESDYNSVLFQNGMGCNSALGMVGGVQILNLQAPGCRFKGLYLHEIGHAVGLVHEHQLPDRDNYIQILYYNVAPHMRIWFNKYAAKEVNQMSVPYELSSVMHYGITAFSKDGKSQTIKALDSRREHEIGRVYLKELSYTDVAIVNAMYDCAAHCPDLKKCGPNGHVDQNCNCICRDGSSDCDKTKQSRTQASCKNKYDSWTCYIWANQGECDRNEHFMKTNCEKACGFCGDAMKTEVCKDVYEDKCKTWRNRGDCITNKRWMRKFCQKSCELCDEKVPKPNANCENKHEQTEKCDVWAKDGECEINPKWMFENCQKSCLLCDKDSWDGSDKGGSVKEENITCDNKNEYCESWASKGECSSNPEWMVPFCRKACKKCIDGTCKNLYVDEKCEIWAQKDECIKNSRWMGNHCAKSCGRGNCLGATTEQPSSTRPTSFKTETTKRSKPTVSVQTTKPTSTTGPCKNRHSSDIECDMWAEYDHCSINPSWMLTNCAKSCGRCTDSTDGTTSGSVEGGKTTTEIKRQCQDTNDNCARWAVGGFCESNPGYSLVHCKKSCNNCNGCRDAEYLCRVWEKSGHCQKNPSYMLRHCQKSCGTCRHEMMASVDVPNTMSENKNSNTASSILDKTPCLSILNTVSLFLIALK